MGAVIEPQGPLPSEIYWRRRIVAGGVVVAVVALVIGLIVWTQTGGDDNAKNAATTASSSATTTPSTATPNASVDPSQAPSGGGLGGGGGDAGTAPESSTPVESSAPVVPGATPADGSVPLCTDQSIAVVLYTDKPTYTTGSQPVFTIVTTNAGLAACTRDVGKAAQNVIVRTLDGTRTLWSARDCSPINTVDNQVLQPQQQVKDEITWSGTTSTAGCKTPRQPVPAGSYQAIGKMGEKESAPVTFNVVAPAQP